MTRQEIIGAIQNRENMLNTLASSGAENNPAVQQIIDDLRKEIAQLNAQLVSLKYETAYEYLLDFKIVAPAQADKPKSLIAAKRDTTRTMGSAWYDIDIKDEVEYLNTL